MRFPLARLISSCNFFVRVTGKSKATLTNNSHRNGGICGREMRFLVLLCLVVSASTLRAAVIPYAGAIGGIATLSADAGSKTTPQGLMLSSYSPSNGGALNVFAGAHVHDYFSLQGNYIWNENELVLNSSSSSGTFYQQARSSSQHAAVLDFLLYFRNRDSWVRPYLGVGGGIIHLSSKAERVIGIGGSPVLPPAAFSSTRPVFRAHVGIDLRILPKVDFRYSFSEFIGHNDISKHLSPPGPRRLANFQNLFGFVVRF